LRTREVKGKKTLAQSDTYEQKQRRTLRDQGGRGPNSTGRLPYGLSIMVWAPNWGRQLCTDKQCVTWWGKKPDQKRITLLEATSLSWGRKTKGEPNKTRPLLSLVEKGKTRRKGTQKRLSNIRGKETRITPKNPGGWEKPPQMKREEKWKVHH